MAANEPLVDVEVTVHGVHQLVWPTPNPHGELNPQDASLLGRLGRLGTAQTGLSTTQLPNPQVRVIINGSAQDTDARQKAPTAIFERQFAWQNISLRGRSVGAGAAVASVDGMDHPATGFADTSIAGHIFSAFLANTEDDDLLSSTAVEADSQLIFMVYHTTYFGKDLIGSYQRSLKSINVLPGHSVHMTKVPLSHPNDPATPRGWLTFSASCVADGESAVKTTSVAQKRELELPKNMQFRAVSRELRVYRARDLVASASGVQRSPRRSTVVNNAGNVGGATDLPSCFVVARHGPSQAIFAVKRRSKTPLWNASVCLPSFAPSADDFVIVELWEQVNSTERMRVAREKISIDQFTLVESQEPPARWIYFYRRLGDIPQEAGSMQSNPGGRIMRYLTQFSKELSLPQGDSDLEDLVASMDSNLGPSSARRNSPGEPTSPSAPPAQTRPFPLDYVGRLLISTCLEPNNLINLDPKPIPARIPVPADPPEAVYNLWIDFYSVFVSLDSQPKLLADPHLLDISVADWKHTELLDGLRENPTQLDLRIPAASLTLPANHLPPLVIRLLPMISTQSTVVSAVFNTRALIEGRSPATPVWHDYTFIPQPKSATSSYVKVLQSITIHKVGEPATTAHVQRPPRVEYALKRYVLSMRVLQAANVPILGQDSFPTSRISIDFEGINLSTSYVNQDSYPEFNLDYVSELFLPNRLELVAPLCLSIVSRKIGIVANYDAGVGGGDVLARVFVSVDHLLKMSLALPEWFVCDQSIVSGDVNPPMILLACQIFSDVDLTQISRLLVPIRHITIPTHISVLGLRLLPLNRFKNALPILNVTWGKNDDESLLRHTLIGVKDKQNGVRGALDDLGNLYFHVYTAASGIYNELLRFEFWQNDDELEGRLGTTSHLRITGLAVFPLLQCASWLPPEMRTTIQRTFNVTFPELDQFGQSNNHILENAMATCPYQRLQTLSQNRRGEECSRGIACAPDAPVELLINDSLTASVYVRKNVEACLGDNRNAPTSPSDDRPTGTPKNRSSLASGFGLTPPQPQRLYDIDHYRQACDYIEVFKKQSESSSYPRSSEAVTVLPDDQDERTDPESTTPNDQQPSQRGADTISFPLERKMNPSQLPYVSVPIFRRYANGILGLIGSVKLIISMLDTPIMRLVREMTSDDSLPDPEEGQDAVLTQSERAEVENLRVTHAEKLTYWKFQQVYRHPFILQLHIFQMLGVARKHPLSDLSQSPTWSLFCRIGDANQTDTDCIRAMKLSEESYSPSEQAERRRALIGADGLHSNVDLSFASQRQQWWDLSASCVNQSSSPEFYVSLELAGYFPLNSILQVCLMEHPRPLTPQERENNSPQVLADAIINSWTHIDLEDRWYHPEWFERIRFRPPIETRELFRPPASTKAHRASQLDRLTTIRASPQGARNAILAHKESFTMDSPTDDLAMRPADAKASTYGHPCGRVILSLTMLQPHELRSHPLNPISPPAAPDLEVRLAVLRVSGVILPQDATPRNLYVEVFMAGDVDLKYRSDTQYRCVDGEAEFNWRFVFRLAAQQRSTRVLILQVWTDNLLSRNELLAEREFDLTTSINAIIARSEEGTAPARGPLSALPQRRDEADLKLDLKSLLDPGAAMSGKAHCSLSIMTSDLAEVHPVGRGRDEPNEDPYLPPVTKNRNIIDFHTNFLDTAMNVSHAIKTSTKWLTIGVVLVFALVILGAVKNLLGR